MHARVEARPGALLVLPVAALAFLAGVLTQAAVSQTSGGKPSSPQGRFGFDRFGRIVLDREKAAVPCPPQTERTAVILAMGQSNAANHAGQGFASRHGAKIVNFFDGACYVAASPLLGATGVQGEYWTETANGLIDSGAYDAVVLSVVAVGGVPVARFAKDGDLNPLVAAAAADFARGGYRVTHALWVQGESDARDETSAEEYRARFRSVVATLRARQPDPRLEVFVGVATKCLPFRPHDPQLPVAIELRRLGASGEGLRAGVDTDVLLGELDRYDQCHFAGSGAEKAARAWAEIIAKDRSNP